MFRWRTPSHILPPLLPPQEKHHAVLMQLLAKQLGVQPEDIVDFELNVCDTQPGVIGGAHPICASVCN